jgi:hypothetical protein
LVFKESEGEMIEGNEGKSTKEGAGETPSKAVVAEKSDGAGLDEFG